MLQQMRQLQVGAIIQQHSSLRLNGLPIQLDDLRGRFSQQDRKILLKNKACIKFNVFSTHGLNWKNSKNNVNIGISWLQFPVLFKLLVSEELPSISKSETCSFSPSFFTYSYFFKDFHFMWNGSCLFRQQDVMTNVACL